MPEGLFISNLHIKSHIPNYSGPLVVIVEVQDKEIFHMAAMLLLCII
jgi:hypothetical protein